MNVNASTATADCIPDFIPFSRPCFTPDAIQEVVDCLQSGWISTGPRVARFEKELSAFVSGGGAHVTALTSASNGLYLALQALGVGGGDEVITTPLTFVATVNAIEMTGARPVFVDVDPNTYNMDLELLESHITPRTRVIMPVHFAGLPVDMGRLNGIAQARGLRVVEDGAHAIGAFFKGQRIGGFGDIQVFSFHATKNMTTGEGGAVVVRDSDVDKRVRLARFYGIDKPAWNRISQKGAHGYDVLAPSLKCNMMDIQAALGIHQLAQLDTFIQRRTVLAERYLRALQQRNYLTVPPQGVGHAWHLFAPLVNERELGVSRDELLKRLAEERVGAGLHYRPVHLFSFYRIKYGFKPGDFPAAEEIGNRILSLPLFPELSFAQQDRVLETLDRIACK